MLRKVTLLIVLSALLMTSGCVTTHTDSNPQWRLEALILEENQTSDEFEVRAGVELAGVYSDDETVSDVRICAKDADGRIMDRAHIGTLSSERRSANATLDLAEPQDTLEVGYGDVQTDQPGYDVMGLNRTSDGVYMEFFQSGSRCPGPERATSDTNPSENPSE